MHKRIKNNLQRTDLENDFNFSKWNLQMLNISLQNRDNTKTDSVIIRKKYTNNKQFIVAYLYKIYLY